MSHAKRNDGSVYDGITYTSTVVLPKKDAKPSRSLHKGYSPLRRARRAVANSLIVVTIVVMGLLGGGGTAQIASANWFEDALKSVVCGPEAYFNEPEMYTSGPTGLGFSPSRYIGKIKDLFNRGDPEFNKAPRTAYEKYGMSGATWTVYRGHEKEDVLKESGNYGGLSGEAKDRLHKDPTCVPFIEVLSTFAANQMFNVSKMLTAIGTATYSAAYDAKIMDDFTTAIAGVIEGSNGNNGLRNALYLEFLGLMLMLGALYLAWVGLVKRQSSTAGSAALWMVGSVIVGSLIIYNPTIIPRAANATVDAVTGAIMTGTTGLAVPNGQSEKDSLCYLPTSAESDSQKRITRIVECSLWSAFIYTPWVSGQFGTSPSQDLSAGLNTPEPVQIGSGKTISNNWALYQLEQQSLDLHSLATKRGSMISSKQNNWGHVRDHMAQNQPELWESWSGREEGARLGVSALAAVASIGGLAVIVTLSVLMIVYQIGLALLMFVAPLFLLVGAHPGFGRGIALRWAEMLAEIVAKRIFLAALLGVMVAFYTIVLGGANTQNANYEYGVSMIMVIALSIAGLAYRKTLMEAFTNIRFGGTQSGIERNPQSMRQTGSIIAGAATGLVTGGVGAAKVAAAAGGGGAGVAAAVRTMAKSGMEGAQRGAYAMSPRAAVAGSVRAGSRTAKAEVAAIQGKKRAEAEARERMLEEAYSENARLDAARAAERDPSTYVRQREAEQRQRAQEVNEFLKHRNDPEYMERLTAKHGGKLPSYLTKAAEEASRPRTAGNTSSAGPAPAPKAPAPQPTQETLFDTDSKGGWTVPENKPEPVQGTLFDMPDSAGPRPATPQPQDSPAPTRRSALPSPTGGGGSGALPPIVSGGRVERKVLGEEVARELREVKREVRATRDATESSATKLERVERQSRRNPPTPPQPPRSRG